MTAGTPRETAMICVAAVIAVGLVTLPFSLNRDTVGVLWLVGAGVLALPVLLRYRYLTTRARAQIELTGGEQYRKLADEYRRLADLAITAQEHTDLKLAEVTAQLDYVREQNDSLHKILTEVE